jgi:hypothetical protein
LTWWIDLEQNKAWLFPGETKNKEAREIYLDADLQAKLNVFKEVRNLLCP